jgi:tetratricopeptide (TPR) repeat protein
MEYTYDNSAGNRRNPQQPPQLVRWGPKSFDEMGDLWIQVLARESDVATLNRDFRSKWIAEDVRGYESLLRNEPGNVALHDDAAALLLELGRRDEAIGHLRASTRLKPDSAAASFNLAAALALAGRPHEAVNHYQDALRIKPDYPAAHYNFGNVLDRLGRLDEALAHYREAVRLNPAIAPAHNNIGFILARLGKLDDALLQYREALRIDPQLADANYNLGVILQRRGELSEAVQHFRAALQKEPDRPAALADLAWVLATAPDERIRDANQGVRFAERAAALTSRRDAEALDALAAGYAARGEFERALATIAEAIGLAPAPAIAAGLLKRQELFRKGQPYRDAGGAR